MSRLIIEILTREAHTGDGRDDSYVALCNYSGELLSKAGVGAGDTERQAAQEAVNSYFTRRAADEQPSMAFTLSSPVITLGTPAPRPARLATTRQEIAALARDSINKDDSPPLTLVYEDADGDETTREIIALDVEEGRTGLGFREDRYLKAIDVAKDEPRTFRIDRIKSLERTDA